MQAKTSMIELQSFFPEDLQIINIEESEASVCILLKSRSRKMVCPNCKNHLTQRRGSYIRKVQDLSILGKKTRLTISAYEYRCDNVECSSKSVAENFDGFLNHHSRMTERCADFITCLALETSCEGASRILDKMGITTSGDSIIRLLLKRFDQMERPICGSTIGIDDFANKKRHTYNTIVVDGTTHKPVAVLDGRDGVSLKEWLKHNQHVRMVTRDRASAYAKVLDEMLPDAIQIADRFHIHNNMMEAVKKALNGAIPICIISEKPQNTSILEGDEKKSYSD